MKKLFLFLILSALSSVAFATDYRALTMQPGQNGVGVYLSWRTLDQDAADDQGCYIYRFKNDENGNYTGDKLFIAKSVLTSDYLHEDGDMNDDYRIRCGTEVTDLATKLENGYLAYNHDINSFGRYVQLADFGDGEFGFVQRTSINNVDPYHSLWFKTTEQYHIHAVSRLRGRLWTHDVGYAIEPGIWYSPFLMHDINADGISDLIIKDGDRGERSIFEDETGRVTKGNEYLSVYDGLDGNTLIARVPWPGREQYGIGDTQPFEDYGRASRNFIAIAYLDGVTPSIIVNRGTYGVHKVEAWTYRLGGLQKEWNYQNVYPESAAINHTCSLMTLEECAKMKKGLYDQWGQGAHSLQAYDVDEDGNDEIVIGAMILDHDGTPYFSVGHGHKEHVDAVYIADHNLSIPGLELYYQSEYWHRGRGATGSNAFGGAGMYNLLTGQIVWETGEFTGHLHGVGGCADFVAEIPGNECYAGEQTFSNFFMWDSNGNKIDDAPMWGNVLSLRSIFWDADPEREIIKGYEGAFTGKMYDIIEYPSKNSIDQIIAPVTGSAPEDRKNIFVAMTADILGDWREELIVTDRNRILVYQTNIPAKSKNVWLMENKHYRSSVRSAGVGYYQTPVYPAPLQ